MVVPDCDGSWTVRTEVADVGRFGARVARLVADRDDAQAVREPEQVGFISVDSGQAIICQLSDAHAGRIDAELVADAMDSAGSEPVPIPGVAAVCSLSGMGDGGYDVLVSRELGSGRPARIEVVFLTEKTHRGAVLRRDEPRHQRGIPRSEWS